MLRLGAKSMVFMAGIVLAGCATAPKDARQQPSGSVPVANAADVALATTDADADATEAAAAVGADPAEAAAAAESQSSSAPEGPVAAQLKPLPEFGVVDLNRQPPAENTGQVCRVMLRPNTNSLINVCGTPAQWQKYKELEAIAAQELLLRMRSVGEMPAQRPMR